MQDKAQNFLNYIRQMMSKETIAVIYETHNIKYEKCILYGDFIQSLMMLVFDTYMGDELTNKTEQLNHFKWCWDKTVQNFAKEGIIIEGDDLFQYFLEFMVEVYYKVSNKKLYENTNKNILKIWSYLFDYNTLKSNADVDTLIETYKLFEKNTKTI